MKANTKHTALLFLILFIGIKVVSLHTLTHFEEDHYQDCEICEYVISSNEVDFSIAEVVVTEVPIYKFEKEIFSIYAYLFEQQQIDNALYCRPPPTA